MQKRVVGAVLSLIGGLVGGALGCLAFVWIVRQGFYALMLPGALLGMGCAALSRNRSTVRGAICAAAALGLGLFAEWKEFPFAADESFGFMVIHFHEKVPIKIVMLIAGAALAFWLGKDSGYPGRLEKLPVDKTNSP